jgi:hypothetical protein
MKLYHGTSERTARKILKHGIKPRGAKKKGNFQHSVPSNPACVYLTDAYGLYFSYNASPAKVLQPPFGNLAVVEIDTDLLDETDLIPDEDVIEQSGRKIDHLPKDWGMVQRTLHYRDLTPSYRDTDGWKVSLMCMGTCCHFGSIPASAVTRVALVSTEKQGAVVLTALDPTISIQNYRFVGSKYRNLTKWVFGEELEEVPQDVSIFAGLPEQVLQSAREGIEIITKEGKS